MNDQKTAEGWFLLSAVVFIRRIIVFLVICLSILPGYLTADWIFRLFFFAWGSLGASPGPTIILLLFWKRTTKWG
ncbi:MAG: hypothetical protein GXO75_02135, partial [Calditrichaeota bacterium]|nr:hypothetical protein [Calditrichota bacterium]